MKEIMVKVETHGHQRYNVVQGLLLLATSTVENYDGKYLQVPALLIRTIDKIVTVPLEGHLFHTEVKIITE